MALLTIERVIQEYWEKIKHEHPNLDYDTFERICKSPFHFIRLQMSKPELPQIQVCEFGTFKVVSRTLRTAIRQNDTQLELRWITPNKHMERDLIYKDILKRVEKDEQTSMEIVDE